MESHGPLLKVTTRLVLATLIIVILVVGQSFLVPLAWSLIIALASVKLVEKMETKAKMPRALAIIVFLLGLLLVLSLIGYFFYLELSYIFADLPAISQKISERLHDISISFREIGISVPEHIDKSFINDWVDKHNDLIMGFISGFGMNIWVIILILFYLFFMLYYRDLVSLFFARKITDKKKLEAMKEKFNKSLILVRDYIYGMLILTLISAVMNYGVMVAFGLQFGLFFAVFLALLNLIPFVGNPIGLVVIMLFAFITNDTWVVPMLLFVGLGVVNFLQDNVIRPWLMGDKLKINAFSVFVAIIIGGMIWGVSGMILFIPIVGTIRILLDGNEKHGHYAIFLSELPKKPKKKKAAVDPNIETSDE